MSARQDDVEILVHIDAASRVADDAHYRQLAEAYLRFEPQHKTVLLPPVRNGEGGEKGHEIKAQPKQQIPAPASSSQEYATPAPMPLLLDSQDLSFQSAFDNMESPRLADSTVGINLDVSKSVMADDGVASQTSWRPPPSEVGDSYPMPDPSLLRVSPSKVLQRYLGSSFSKHAGPSPVPASSSSPSRASQARSVVEVPSSPVKPRIEVPSSQPELPQFPTIPSSPPLATSDGVIPISIDRSVGEESSMLPNASTDALDITHVSLSFDGVDPWTSKSQQGDPSLPSDDFLDITHISGSSVGDFAGNATSQQDQLAHQPDTRASDPMDVTNLSRNSTVDRHGSRSAQQVEELETPSDDLKDVTHISGSLVGCEASQDISRKQELPQNPGRNLDVTRISSSSFGVNEAEPVEPTVPSSPPPAKRRKQTQDSVQSSTTTLDPGIVVSGQPSPPAKTLEIPASKSIEIVPPSPSASLQNLHPQDLIPSQLSKLAHDLSSRYRPVIPLARALDPLERGYWLLDCSAWPESARAATWTFLERYIRSGLAGWGLWCRREEEPHRRLRVYCWGCAVKHAYLLLYLASERRLKGTGAMWIDAAGEVAVKVPAHGK